jgi:hypothetical protein
MRPASRAEEELNDLGVVGDDAARESGRGGAERFGVVGDDAARESGRGGAERFGVVGDDAACESGRIIGGGDGKTSN